MLDALASNNAAMVLKKLRTGWITTESCVVVKVIVLELHLSMVHKHFHVETPLQDAQEKNCKLQ